MPGDDGLPIATRDEEVDYYLDIIKTDQRSEIIKWASDIIRGRAREMTKEGREKLLLVLRGRCNFFGQEKASRFRELERLVLLDYLIALLARRAAAKA